MSPWAAELNAVRVARANTAFDAMRWPRPQLDADDPLWNQYNRREALWNAPIRWGDPIVGSTALLEPDGAPWGKVQLLYSFDARADAQPALIAQVSSRLVDLWQGSDKTSPLGVWAESIRHTSRASQMRVPDVLANGYAVFVTTGLVCRAHLPNERMRFERLPIFAPRELDGPIMPVPAALWPPSLLQDWMPAEA